MLKGILRYCKEILYKELIHGGVKMGGCCNGPVRADVTLKVEGMSCAHCKKAVETAVGALPGVSKTEAIVDQGKVNVSYDASKVRLEDIKKAIEDAGYEVQE